MLKQAAIGYGRRTTIRVVDAQGHVQQVPNPGLAGLDAADQAKQTTPLLTYTENRVTNAIESADTLPHPAALRGAHLRADRLRADRTGRPLPGRRTSSSPIPTLAGRLRHKFTDRSRLRGRGRPATSAAARSSGCARSTAATI